jgi:hypothetical protein
MRIKPKQPQHQQFLRKLYDANHCLKELGKALNPLEWARYHGHRVVTREEALVALKAFDRLEHALDLGPAANEVEDGFDPP